MPAGPTTFADVILGRVPVQVIAEDAAHVAFLAPRPFRRGHLIVATRVVVDGVFDLDPAQHAALWAFVREVGRMMRVRLPCARVCVSVIGWVVRHAHVHLVPTDAAGEVSGLDGPALDVADAEALARRLRGC